jgi:hypothetical protein
MGSEDARELLGVQIDFDQDDEVGTILKTSHSTPHRPDDPQPMPLKGRRRSVKNPRFSVAGIGG